MRGGGETRDMPFVLVFTAHPALEVPKTPLWPMFVHAEGGHAVCIGFYNTSCTRSAENTGVADVSCGVGWEGGPENRDRGPENRQERGGKGGGLIELSVNRATARPAPPHS